VKATCPLPRLLRGLVFYLHTVCTV